jgi:hypothetical protein
MALVMCGATPNRSSHASVTATSCCRSGVIIASVDLTLPDKGRLLLVSFVERGGFIRIISARYADKEERNRYEEDIL